LNTPRMPKPAQKCMKPCKRPVAAKKAGTERLSRQTTGTWDKTRTNPRMAVVPTPVQPARILLAISADPILQTPG